MFKGFFSVLIFTISIQAFSSLQVYPTKVLLSKKSRVATITVKNKDTKPTTYKAQAVFYGQDNKGNMALVEKPSIKDHSLSENIRFSPKRFRLAPGETQVVRIMVRRVSKLSEGDYRAHIRFEPQDDELVWADAKKKFQFHLEAKVAVSIPVIYSDLKNDGVEMNHFNVFYDPTKKENNFSVELTRKDKTFPFGELQVYFKEYKQENLLGMIRGISIYSNKRSLNYPLREMKSELVKGKYILIFKSSKTGKVLARQEYIKN